MRKKEIHLYLDDESIYLAHPYTYVRRTYKETAGSLMSPCEQIHTTITHFLNWRYGERLFCHQWDWDKMLERVYEITLGECIGTNRKIKETHNIEKLLLAGEFSWFKP